MAIYSNCVKAVAAQSAHNSVNWPELNNKQQKNSSKNSSLLSAERQKWDCQWLMRQQSVSASEVWLTG